MWGARLMAVTVATVAETAAAAAVAAEASQQQQPWMRGGLCIGPALGLVGGSSGACPQSICTNINSPDCSARTVDAWAANFVNKS